MTGPERGREPVPFRRYLAAKRTVDDRALDGDVADRFARELAARPTPVEVLEIGAGIGTMLERLLGRDRLPPAARYVVLDADPDLIAAAGERLPSALDGLGLAVERDGDALIATGEGRRLAVDLVAADAFDFVAAIRPGFDAVVAAAFLDLVALRPAVADLARALGPGGLLYAPITFDGGTVFEPALDPAFGDHLLRRYHRTMGRGGRAGSRAGRDLPDAVRAAGGTVLATGRSDWVVEPRDGDYPGDEAAFLRHLLDTVGDALADDPAVDDDRLGDWVRRRHGQVDAATLRFRARNVDLLARFHGDGPGGG